MEQQYTLVSPVELKKFGFKKENERVWKKENIYYISCGSCSCRSKVFSKLKVNSLTFKCTWCNRSNTIMNLK